MTGAPPSLLRRLDTTGVPLAMMRLMLGVTFVWMGVSKIANPAGFLKNVRLFELLPEAPPYYLNGTAIVLPWLEVFCGTALILGLWIRGAAALIAVMLAVFTPAILIRALRIYHEGTPFFDIQFDCGCGTGEVVIWKKLLTNSGLFVLAVLAVASGSRRFTLAAWFDRNGTATPSRDIGRPDQRSLEDAAGEPNPASARS